jgi:histidine triad (HIT) family protein
MTMPRDPQCIFCKIVAVEVPAAIVYEDDRALAFLDIGPLAEGHLLVISREHYARVTDFPADRFSAVAAVIPRLIGVVQSVTGCEGVNILVNNGSAAGQVVNHVHWHLIPRRSGDGLGYRWNAGEYSPGRAEELAAAFRTALARRA